MTWLNVVAVLVKLLGPVLVEWLARLLDDAAREMTYNPSASPGQFDADLAALFDRARGKVWWFQFRKAAALRLARQAALRRSDQIRSSAVSGTAVAPLTAEERVALGAALS
jgi:hypothetical protein